MIAERFYRKSVKTTFEEKILKFFVKAVNTKVMNFDADSIYG